MIQPTVANLSKYRSFCLRDAIVRQRGIYDKYTLQVQTKKILSKVLERIDNNVLFEFILQYSPTLSRE